MLQKTNAGSVPAQPAPTEKPTRVLNPDPLQTEWYWLDETERKALRGRLLAMAMDTIPELDVNALQLTLICAGVVSEREGCVTPMNELLGDLLAQFPKGLTPDFITKQLDQQYRAEFEQLASRSRRFMTQYASHLDEGNLDAKDDA